MAGTVAYRVTRDVLFHSGGIAQFPFKFLSIVF